jgi:cytoskeletal protein CcmA (bactofilin family)
MALFGRDREGFDQPREVGPGVVEPLRGPGPGEVKMFERERDKNLPDELSGMSAFLGKGSRITGKLVFEGAGRIEGQVDGEVNAQDTLIIGESAVVNAQITGTAVVVHGKVTGDITARTRLEIRAPSKVFGNITTPSLVIHEGAVFEGQCAMGDAAKGDKKAPSVVKDGLPIEPLVRPQVKAAG